ncbi:hypothetical protein GGI1_01359 [Acidithiobacillus sp. GGI-221]|nr:hypothetical protein GGI1_01359 [Acidithiobacillus sp. GGI-221]
MQGRYRVISLQYGSSLRHAAGLYYSDRNIADRQFSFSNETGFDHIYKMTKWAICIRKIVNDRSMVALLDIGKFFPISFQRSLGVILAGTAAMLDVAVAVAALSVDVDDAGVFCTSRNRRYQPRCQ